MTYEQYCSSDINEGIKDTISEITSNALSILPTKKKKIEKYLNNEDITVEELHELIIELYGLKKQGQELKLGKVEILDYNESLNILIKILDKLDVSLKLPQLNIIKSKLVIN